MWFWRRMEKINLTERKTNEEILDIVKLDVGKWLYIVYALRQPEQTDNIITKGIIERKITAG